MTPTTTTFETAMTRAELAALHHLAAATHTRPGHEATLGPHPPQPGAWAFTLAEIPPPYGAPFLTAAAITNIAQHATAKATFPTRARAQTWIMQIIAATPWSNTGAPGGNVARLRIRPGGIHALAPAKTNPPAWTAQIDLDITYLTGAL